MPVDRAPNFSSCFVQVPALLAIVVSTLIGVLDESTQVVAAQPRV